MIRSAASTVATRVLVMAANLATIMAVGHTIGSEGLGLVSLIVLAITFILLLNNVVGGGALTYLVPRHPLRRLLPPAYLWALCTALIAAFALKHLALVPDEYANAVILLALIQSSTAIHGAVLLGQQRIGAYNAVHLTQAIVLPLSFLLLFRFSGDHSILNYIDAAYIASAAAALLAAVAVTKHRNSTAPADHGQRAALLGMLRQGGWVQSANLLQLLNYRLAYYLIERWLGMAALGIYSVTTQLAESAWLGPKSLGTVLYARVSNTAERDGQRSSTIAILKGSVALAAAAVLVLLVVPDPIYGIVFGSEVKGVQPLLLILVPGLLSMAASQAYSHFFSGVGLNRHNAIGSAIGLGCTVIFGYWSIPTHGLAGAAATASLAYSANATYQMFVFMRVTNSAFRDLLPRPKDLGMLRTAWRERANDQPAE